MEHQTEDYGVGGKLTRKPLRPSRVSSASPYTRPPLPVNNNKKTSSKGWFSKLLVTPASKVLPSLFRNSSSKNQDDKHMDLEEEANDETVPELEQEDVTVPTLTEYSNLLLSKDSGIPASTKKVENSSDACGIEEIERQFQQNMFSKDETDHLLELMRSRITAPVDDNVPSKNLNTGVSDYRATQKAPGQPTKEGYHVHFDHQTTPMSTEHYRFKGNNVSSSPIDIAKAYMESRSSSGYSNSGAKTSSSLSFTPGAKSPMHWPVTDAQDANEYFTPRRGIMPHHPRTPYSTLFSKSTSKYQVNADRFTRSSSTQSTACVLDQNMMSTRSKSLGRNFIEAKTAEATYKEAGPRKNTTESSLSKGGIYKFDQSTVADEAFKLAATTPVHPHSSLTARRILEHLDRSVPSPKEKLQEIKLARMRVPPRSDALIVDEKLDVGITNTRKSAEHQVVSQQGTGSCIERDQIPPAHMSNQSVFSLSSQSSPSCPVFQVAENRSSVSSMRAKEKAKVWDNGLNFTFPLPKTPALNLDPPPTPSMPRPLHAADRAHKEKQGEDSNAPLFNFGSSGKRLAFSFTSDATAIDNDPPLFNFATDHKRLSFKSLGGDALCC